jgi:RNA polymerase sigma factor (sigma-70 family)
VPVPGSEPFDHLWEQERARAVRDALDGLSEGQQAVIRLRVDGLTYDKIAARLGVPRSTVVSQVEMIMRKLATKLTPYGGEPASPSSGLAGRRPGD